MESKAQPETVFYDGHCGLCHRFVHFLLWADRDGARFEFAPLGGELFLATVAEPERAGLPDSVVLRTADGRLLMRSAAVLHVLQRLGGVWRVLEFLGRIVPGRARDALYDFIARVRYRLFARQEDVCPVMPPHLRARFHK